MTATPYRMGTGQIASTGGILNRICYEISVRKLIEGGYLSPLTSRISRTEFSDSDIETVAGEYSMESAERVLNIDSRVRDACREIADKTRDRKSVLIFCATIAHAQHVRATLQELGCACDEIFGDTKSDSRAISIAKFKTGETKFLVNVSVLTTGFDAPNVDCVVLMRPTLSIGLYYQMVGRGFRLSEGKKNCLVLDFAGNVYRHGPIDDLNEDYGRDDFDKRKKFKKKKFYRTCPDCLCVFDMKFSVCPTVECQRVFDLEAEQIKNRSESSSEDVLSDTVLPPVTMLHRVTSVDYSVHTKVYRDSGLKTQTLVAKYDTEYGQFAEYICIEHTGFAGRRARAWWGKIAPRIPFPDNVNLAVFIARNDPDFLVPIEISVTTIVGDYFPKIEITDFKIRAPKEFDSLGLPTGS